MQYKCRKIIGLENLTKEPCVIVSNHQGQWETFSMQYLFHPLCTLLKKELLYIPLWGWAMKLLQPIAIDRSKPKEAIMKTLKDGSDRLSNGMYVLLFPEGTRVEAGRVGNYARSSFELAKEIMLWFYQFATTLVTVGRLTNSLRGLEQ